MCKKAKPNLSKTNHSNSVGLANLATQHCSPTTQPPVWINNAPRNAPPPVPAPNRTSETLLFSCTTTPTGRLARMGGCSSPSDVEFLNNDIPVRITQRSLGRRNYAGRPKIRTLIPIPEHNAPTNKSNQLLSLPPPKPKFLFHPSFYPM